MQRTHGVRGGTLGAGIQHHLRQQARGIEIGLVHGLSTKRLPAGRDTHGLPLQTEMGPSQQPANLRASSARAARVRQTSASVARSYP